MEFSSSNIEDLRKICMVLEFDGFTIEKKFVVRELGYCSVGYPFENESFKFNIKKSIAGMCAKDWETNFSIKRNIHGLTLRPNHKEKCFDESLLEDVIKYLYKDHKGVKKYIVGYKGGIHEKKVLDKLNIPSLNIEKFGCPKIDILIEDFLLSDVSDIYSCGFHSKLKNVNKIAHCVKFETFCFVKWIKLQI